MIINYIKNQKEHHKAETFYDEFKRLLIENGIEFDEKYLLQNLSNLQPLWGCSAFRLLVSVSFTHGY